MTVGAASIAGMWIYIVAVLAAIVAVFWIFGHRVEMNLSTMILGAIAYFVFDTILLAMVFDNIVVGTFSRGLYDTITTNPMVFVPYYAITRGLFYMLGMYIATRMSMRSDTPGGGVAIAIGFTAGFGIMNRNHGIWTVFQAWRTAHAVNAQGGVDAYLALMRAEEAEAEDIESMRVSLDALCDTTLGYYIVNVVEVLLIMGALFAMAVIIHLAVTRRAPYRYLGLSVPMYMVVMLPTAVMLAGLMPGGRVVYDVLLAAVCGGTIALAAVLAKKYMKNPMKW